MYNLLVTCQDGLWDTGSCEYDRLRVIKTSEYTAEDLVKKYGSFDKDAIDQLSSRPALFAYENGTQGDARVGWIKHVRTRDNLVKVDYELDLRFPPISNEKLDELKWELLLGDWELNRSHWALKDADLFATLVKANLINSYHLNHLNLTSSTVEETLSYSVNPVVFRKPTGVIENDLVAVMMPFKSSFDKIYESIRGSCAKAGLRCQRADEVWQASEIMQDVFSLIYRSQAVICDFSEGNPNVFYEAGIAHTLGKHVLPIVQHNTKVPFDLGHHRYIEYYSNGEGLVALEGRIEERLSFLLSSQLNNKPASSNNSLGIESFL